MLHSKLIQSDRTPAVLGEVNSIPLSGHDGIGAILNLVLGLLRRQYIIIVFTTVLALAAGITYLRTTPPTYTAQVQILLGNPKPQFVQQQSLVAEPSFDLTQIDTQLQILKSRAIAISVINQLNLAEDPNLKESTSLLVSLVRRIKSLLGVKAATDTQSISSERLTENLVAAFQDKLSAARINYSNVIELKFSWNDAARSAEIANAIANAYISDQLNAKFEANKNATEWLQSRLQQLGDQAETAERAVNAYKSQNNIISTDGKLIEEQRVTDINSRLVAARAQTTDAEVRLHRYESILNENPTNSQSIGSLDAAGADTLNSTIITNLRSQYLELSRRENEWTARFGKDHLSVISLRNRMRDLRASILDEVRRLAESSKSDLETAKQRQQELEKQLTQAVSSSRSTNSAEVTLRELESRAKGYRSLYETFLQRYMGSAQQESFPVSEARVIYPAFPPQTKSKPKNSLILALALFGGIGLGGGLGFLRDLMDRVFRTPDQIEASLHLPCLSVVPLLRSTAPRGQTMAGNAQLPEEAQLRTVSRASPVHSAVVNMPLSRFAESIRSIKLGIDLNLTQASNKVIGFTSSLPNEGKSTIASALAQLVGHGGKRVILVDCDLRNPSLTAALAPNASAGLLEVLSGTRSLDDIVWKDPKTNLVFLPVVKRRPLLHSSEVLANDQMRKLFDSLRSSYDYIIVDLPPLTPIVDVRTTSTLVDCFVLIVEWGRTKIDVAQHALHTAPNVYENLIGAVLNKTDIKSMALYDAYRSDYYSDSHYVQYGVGDSG